MKRLQGIRDDNGYWWHYSPAKGKIIMDLDDTRPVSQRGYYANSWRGALLVLYGGRYISKQRYDEEWAK